jgi:hypothetical protein
LVFIILIILERGPLGLTDLAIEENLFGEERASFTCCLRTGETISQGRKEINSAGKLKEKMNGAKECSSGITDFSDGYYNFKKLPWEDPEEHLRRSPISYVGNVKTPTMRMTGELDLRTPTEQTEQFYRARKLRKVDTVMVRIAGEYHPINAVPGLRHPSNRIAQILYLRGWFEKYRKR